MGSGGGGGGGRGSMCLGLSVSLYITTYTLCFCFVWFLIQKKNPLLYLDVTQSPSFLERVGGWMDEERRASL